MDLFAGCGGFAQGFRQYALGSGLPLRFRIVAAVEYDLAAASTYEANFPGGMTHRGDIDKFDLEDVELSADVITGSPPCQGFSGLGPETPGGSRNPLLRQYMRIVWSLQPKVFVLENADRFLRLPEFEQLKAAAEPGGDLQDYHLEHGVLNAADFGVPQSRRRAIVIGTHRDLPPLKHPLPTHAKEEPERPLAQALSDLDMPPLLPWESVAKIFRKSEILQLSRDLPARKCQLLDDTVPGVFETADLHIGRKPTPLSLARYAAIPPGGNRNDLRGKTAQVNGPEEQLLSPVWDSNIRGTAHIMGRMHIDRPSATIRSEFFKPEKGRYLHPVENRAITHYEAALIQGFPDHYRWCGTKIQVARQIGSALPVGLSSALAAAIHNHLKQ